jgi:uncharacterized protein YdaU (DUF1376 family)
MSLAEKGLYLDLLDRHYAEGSLPSDEAMLARLTGASPAEFNRAWRRVQMEFESDPSQPGRLIQPEVSAELAAMDRYAAQQAEKGRKGGRPKKAVALQRVSSGKAVVNPLESHEDLDLDLDKKEPTPPTPPCSPDGFNNQAAFDAFRKAYPKDTGLYGQEITSAWEDIVETAVNQAVIWGEVKRGLVRMNASGTPDKFIPSAAKFLRERKFLELWAPRDGRPVAKALKKCGCGEWITECVGLDCGASICPQCDPLNGWHLGTDPLCQKCLEEANEVIEKNKQILQEMR